VRGQEKSTALIPQDSEDRETKDRSFTSSVTYTRRIPNAKRDVFGRDMFVFDGRDGKCP
jgi:hypothetical protein